MYIAFAVLRTPQRSPVLWPLAKRPHGAMRNIPTILIIGGDVRRFQLDKLRAALCGLSVDWIPTRESDPGTSRFEAKIGRQETSLVVILCGLIRHQHSHDITRLCRRHGRRLLRLHRSVNIHAIASTFFGVTLLPAPSDKPFIRQEVRA